MIDLKRRKRAPIVPLSSMSDIGFLLLIFIMLVALINQRHEVPIEYSEARKLENTQESENLEIWIESGGQVSADGFTLTEAELEMYIVKRLSEKPGTRVHVIADRHTPYRHVNAVVRILQTLQHRVVSFVVKEAP